MCISFSAWAFAIDYCYFIEIYLIYLYYFNITTLVEPKLLKQKGSSRNIRQVIIKWILGTTIGFSVGGSITSLWINLIGSTSAQILIFQIALIIIFIGLGQGLIIKWSTKELFQWLLAHIISILASLLIGLLLYFLSISIGVSITGSGLGAIFFILIIAPLLIILSTGIIYGCVTLYCLSSFLDQNKFE